MLDGLVVRNYYVSHLILINHTTMLDDVVVSILYWTGEVGASAHYHGR